jgi:hypothetical protein
MSQWRPSKAVIARCNSALGPYRASWPAGFGFPDRLLQAAASVDTIAATLAEAALAPALAHGTGLGCATASTPGC